MATSRREPRQQPPPSSEEPGLLSWLASLPGVSQLTTALTTWNIGPMTELLERAAYLPVALKASSLRQVRAGSDWFEVAGTAHHFELRTVPGVGGLEGRQRQEDELVKLSFLWRLIPADYVGSPQAFSPLPSPRATPRLDLAERFEIRDWRLTLAGGRSGLVAYGTGQVLPGDSRGRACVAFILDVVDAWGELAGLPGTVVGCGGLDENLELEIDAVARIMDPSLRLRHAVAVPPAFPAAGSLDGATYYTFLGEVDFDNPVTLRVSLTEGILGSNVYERIQGCEVGFDVDGQGRLVGQVARRGEAGAVSARLSFDPLSFCALGPIQTRRGIFELQDATGIPLGSIAADMIEGRSLRTWLPDQLLPVFRFGGFGPVTGGTGRFAGARGVMTMNSVVSVQPRTLSNLYLLRLEGGSEP